MKRNRLLNKVLVLLLTIAALAAGQQAQAETFTKTYLFEGHMEYYLEYREGLICEGYFYEEGLPLTHYNSTPTPWIYGNIPPLGSIGSISFALADDITFTFESSTNKISAHSDFLGGEGDVTFTFSGRTYYIWYVTVYDRRGNLLFADMNLNDANPQNTNTFSKTINAGTEGLSVGKIEITCSEQDIYLIDDSSTTISGVNEVYSYTGGNIYPEPVVECNGRTLTKDVHYTILYQNAVNPGITYLSVQPKFPYHSGLNYVRKYYTISDVELENSFTQLSDGSYEIANQTDLERLAEFVNKGRDCGGLTFRQTADIVCNYDEIDDRNSSIGSYVRPFRGTYDGQNHVIHNIRIYDRSLDYLGETVFVEEGRFTDYYNYYFYDGLFPHLNGGTVKDLRLVNPEIVLVVNRSTSCEEAYMFLGGIAGYAEGSTIENCFVYNPVLFGSMQGKHTLQIDDAIVGKSDNNTTTTGSAQVYQATAGDNVSFANNTIAEGDGFIYNGGRYYKADATIPFNYTGLTAANPINFTDDNGNALTFSGSGNSYSLVMPNMDITFNAALVITELNLANNGDNTSAIANAASTGQLYNVTLAGRTLYKDGKWNTLCLPFDVTVGSGQMEGATAMTLNGSQSGFDASTGVLTLNFDGVTSGNTITAGTPFIVKWTGSNVTDPVFSGVTVNSTPNDDTFTGGAFKGTYAKKEYTDENRSILFMGGSNTLYYPGNGASIGAFRAYFQLTEPSPVKQFVLNFGEDEDATVIKDLKDLKDLKDSWYDLSGRKIVNGQMVNGKLPRGIYIHNGKKVIVK